MHKFRKLLLSLSGLYFLSACAYSNEGAVDYRKAELHKGDQKLICNPATPKATENNQNTCYSYCQKSL